MSRYQWSTGLTFKELTALGLGLTQAIAMFNPLHEADWTSFEMVATDIIRRENRDNSWLRTARKINGFTQEQLAAKSGVSIRLIRAYEQEKINISNAEYSTIMRLRNALNCA